MSPMPIVSNPRCFMCIYVCTKQIQIAIDQISWTLFIKLAMVKIGLIISNTNFKLLTQKTLTICQLIHI